MMAKDKASESERQSETTATSLRYRFYASDMMSLEYSGSFPETNTKKESIACTACIVKATERTEIILFLCRFHVEAASEGSKGLFKVVSEYINLVEADVSNEADTQAIATDVIQRIIWEQFRSLYSVITAQAVSKGPVLPPSPETISFVDVADFQRATAGAS